MDIDSRAREIDLEGGSGVTFFLIHGYTGSPTDFNGLPFYINEKFDFRVKGLLLPGHGTVIKDLDKVTYEDVVDKIESDFKKEIDKGNKIIIGGVSFGALMALRLAANYSVGGVINVCVPYSMKPPFGLPGMRSIFFYKKYWKKKVSEEERVLRKNSFHYDKMHIKGLELVKRARKDVAQSLESINCPVLTIHSVSDPIGGLRGVNRLQKKIRAPHKVIVYNNKNHNIFFSDRKEEVYREIGGFITKSQGKWRKAQKK